MPRHDDAIPHDAAVQIGPDQPDDAGVKAARAEKTDHATAYARIANNAQRTLIGALGVLNQMAEAEQNAQAIEP